MKPPSQVCKKHNNLRLEFFCTFHDTVCCQICMSQYHRTCAKILPIDVAAKGAKRSRITDDLLSQLESVHDTLDGIKQRKLENIKEIEDQDKVIRSTVSKLRQKVIERLNVIEKELYDELSNLKKVSISKLEQEARKIQNAEDVVKSYKEHVDFEKEHGTDRETFYTVHVIKSHMADIEEGMLQTKSRTGFISIVFRENGDILENLNTFGSLSLKSSTKTTTFRKDAQLVTKEEYKEKFIQSFDYSYEFNVSADQDVMITGMAITDDKRLLLCGGGKYNIIVCTLQGKHLQDCKLAGEPWDVAITTDRDRKAVATLPYLYALQFINISSMTAGKMVKFDWRVYGIATINKHIIVGGRSCLLILDNNGTKLYEMAVPSISVFYIHPRENSDIYYSDSTNVYCMKSDGRHVFCQNLSNLESPRNIVTDNRGNIYVVGHRSNNLHRLTSDGIALDILLSKKDGLKGPFVLCFSENQRILFVSNNNGKTITAYTTVYAPPSKEAEIQELLRYL